MHIAFRVLGDIYIRGNDESPIGEGIEIVKFKTEVDRDAFVKERPQWSSGPLPPEFESVEL